ncbi:hypothetical protein TTHERM_00655620 (macronuclear) [Tetrahymena thermophila SB210]|uniref:Uncharacterized protein n=1 Tax=Tetrahymena thermophila (strain SB210) TaxID=312017 RepID=Q22GZ0_TETTS|nr:hypothetical protein TTHERM_00655620 [Tetrahymena thermophila SB210]EAR84534.2 hypothetical protein TTHERM_00655620 [Tetrahymena thermophila SB210]|eukprot:XP_001032197.2 hypothetical protein TTHERM_00655620 [Tetrahymena thermophila SB210]
MQFENEQLNDESKQQNSLNQLLQNKSNMLQLSSVYPCNQDFIQSQNYSQNNKSSFFRTNQFENEIINLQTHDKQNISTFTDNNLNGTFLKQLNNIENSQIYYTNQTNQKQQSFQLLFHQSNFYKKLEQKNNNNEKNSLVISRQSILLNQPFKSSKIESKRKSKSINQLKQNKTSGKNMLNFDEKSTYSMYLEQKAIMSLAKQNFYTAADYFTKILEESKFIFPFILNQSIQKLIQIFSTYKINCQILDQIIRFF